MAIPQITNEERQKALEAAKAARAKRAEVLNDFKDGKITLEEIFAMDDKTIKRTKVFSLLKKIPGVGATKAQHIMDEIGIAESRRIGGLGVHQAQELINRFGSK